MKLSETRFILIVSKPISIVAVVVVVQKVISKNVWYKRIEVKKILIQKNFGTKIGFNIACNIAVNFGVQYWVKYWVQYLVQYWVQ